MRDLIFRLINTKFFEYYDLYCIFKNVNQSNYIDAKERIVTLLENTVTLIRN